MPWTSYGQHIHQHHKETGSIRASGCTGQNAHNHTQSIENEFFKLNHRSGSFSKTTYTHYTSQAHNQFYAKYTKSHEFYFCFRPEKVQPSSASNGFLTVWMFVYKKDPAVQTPKAAPTLFFTQLKLWTIYANLQYFATKSISSFSLNCVQLGPSTTTDSLVNLFLFCWPRWLEDFLSSVRRAEYKMSFYPWPYRKREMEEI